MRLHRFFLKTPIEGQNFDITDRDLVHQWRNVFRYNVGSQVILFDGSGIDYLGMITSMRNLGASVEIIDKKGEKQTKKIDLWLVLAITKKDNFEVALEKVTEIGANYIVPLISDRTEKKNLNMDRLEKIAEEASEQSGRGDIPKIYEIFSLEELLKSEMIPKNRIVLDLGGKYIGDFLLNNKSSELAVFIGPEGGWTEKEIDLFKTHDIPFVSLGSQVLRAETAAIAISSLLLL